MRLELARKARGLSTVTDPVDIGQGHLTEIRAARDRAEFLRDQLFAAYEGIAADEAVLAVPRRRQGREAMRKAIAAAERAIASIDQALREIERVQDETAET